MRDRRLMVENVMVGTPLALSFGDADFLGR
jgi:hypothetical protein